MLKSVGVQYVIIGHSERREYFKETNQQLAEKVNIVLEGGLLPIFCCGETLDERNSGKHIDIVTEGFQLPRKLPPDMVFDPQFLPPVAERQIGK